MSDAGALTARGDAALQRGMQHMFAGGFEQGADEALSAALAYERAGDVERQALAQTLGAAAAVQIGALDEARRRLEDATRLARGAEDGQLVASVLEVRGDLEAFAGRPKLARAAWEEAARLYDELGEAEAALRGRAGCVEALLMEGDVEASTEVLERHEEAWLGAGDREARGRGMAARAALAGWQGDVILARDQLDAAADELRVTFVPTVAARAAWSAGRGLLEAGLADDAVVLLEQAHEMFLGLEHWPGVTATTLLLARAHEERGHAPTAHELVCQGLDAATARRDLETLDLLLPVAIALSRELWSERDTARHLAALARLERRRSRTGGAIRALTEALELGLDEPEPAAVELLELASSWNAPEPAWLERAAGACAAAGHAGEAWRMLEGRARQHQRGGDLADGARMLATAALLAASDGELGAADGLWSEAIGTAQRLGLGELETWKQRHQRLRDLV